jgi:HSP20 family protein
MLPILRNRSDVPSTWVDPFELPIGRLFNGALSNGSAFGLWPLSMWEDDQHVYVEMDAPGLSHDDIEVSVHEGVLTIQGERKQVREHDGYDARSYGRFERQLRLPTGVDAEKVDAKLASGVLSLTLPKVEAARPRRIEVKTV